MLLSENLLKRQDVCVFAECTLLPNAMHDIFLWFQLQKEQVKTPAVKTMWIQNVLF